MSNNLDSPVEDDVAASVPVADEIGHDEARFVLARRDAARALDPIAGDVAVHAVQGRIRSLVADEFEAWAIACDSVTEEMIDKLIENDELASWGLAHALTMIRRY